MKVGIPLVLQCVCRCELWMIPIHTQQDNLLLSQRLMDDLRVYQQMLMSKLQHILGTCHLGLVMSSFQPVSVSIFLGFIGVEEIPVDESDLFVC